MGSNQFPPIKGGNKIRILGTQCDLMLYCKFYAIQLDKKKEIRKCECLVGKSYHILAPKTQDNQLQALQEIKIQSGYKV